jgi:opacity protein-like surface antigen
MNKIFLTSAIAVTSLVTMPASSNSSFDGFYAGVSAGYSSLDAKKKTYYVKSYDYDLPYVLNSDAKSNNTSGGVNFGFAHKYKSLYMAYELSALFDKHSATTKFSETDELDLSESLKRDWAFGLTMHPGLYLNDKTVVYGKLGVSLSEFKYQADAFVTYAVTGSSKFSESHSKNLWGMTFGAGVRTELSDNYSLTAEAFHTTYQQYKTPNFAHNWTNSLDVIKTENMSSKMKPRSTHFTVGLNIKI